MGQAEGLVSQLRKWLRSVGAKDARLNKAQRPWQPTFQRGDGAGFLSSPIGYQKVSFQTMRKQQS